MVLSHCSNNITTLYQTHGSAHTNITVFCVEICSKKRYVHSPNLNKHVYMYTHRSRIFTCIGHQCWNKITNIYVYRYNIYMRRDKHAHRCTYLLSIRVKARHLLDNISWSCMIPYNNFCPVSVPI